MKKIGHLSHFTVSFLTGGRSSVDALTPKTQKDTLDSFRSGKVNLLFSTDIAEEGIDVPDCSCVKDLICQRLLVVMCSHVDEHARRTLSTY
ncbi:hypothetical protein BRADI_2g23190v3 [Brachypodium distachyon]|uniref:Helicase C-terminal domain-containing protein n=1 Tax=Brachypodium distachyon TaxID=15368 RepID=A0A2K2DA03_BRADI|nr:hypothetical protein BRADI_2g23190v3 [Brachypodium distachyon]